MTSKAARVFEELGHHVEETDLAIDPPYDTFGPLIAADSYNNQAGHLETYGDQMTDFARFIIERGAQVTTAEYAQALGQIDLLKAHMTDLFEKYDLLLSPTACFAAFANGGQFPGPMSGKTAYPEQYWNGAFTLPINAIGHPAASIPAGFSSENLPIGLHIVGRKGDDETVLAASAAFERARPWLQHRPPVC